MSNTVEKLDTYFNGFMISSRVKTTIREMADEDRRTMRDFVRLKLEEISENWVSMKAQQEPIISPSN